MWAALIGNEEIASLLIKETNSRPFLNDSHFRNAFHMAVRSGNPNIIEKLIEEFQGINKTLAQYQEEDEPREEYEPMLANIDSSLVAAIHGKSESLSYLTSLGIDLGIWHESIGEFTLMTPLHWSSLFGHSKAVDTILKALEKYPAYNKEVYKQLGLTPLMLALSSGHTEVAKMLIKKGANVDYEKIEEMEAHELRRTPLYLATTNNDLSMVKAIVENRHSLFKEPDFGVVYVMYMAIEQGHFDIAKYLTDSLHMNVSRMDDDDYDNHFYAHVSYMNTIFKSSYGKNSHGYVGSFRRMVHFFVQSGARLEALIDFRDYFDYNYGLLQSQGAATLSMYRDRLCKPGSHKEFCHADIATLLAYAVRLDSALNYLNYQLANLIIELTLMDFHPSWLSWTYSPHIQLMTYTKDVRIVDMVMQRLGNTTNQIEVC